MRKLPRKAYKVQKETFRLFFRHFVLLKKLSDFFGKAKRTIIVLKGCCYSYSHKCSKSVRGVIDTVEIGYNSDFIDFLCSFCLKSLNNWIVVLFFVEDTGFCILRKHSKTKKNYQRSAFCSFLTFSFYASDLKSTVDRKSFHFRTPKKF